MRSTIKHHLNNNDEEEKRRHTVKFVLVSVLLGSATGTANAALTVDASTLDKKVMAGYQRLVHDCQ